MVMSINDLIEKCVELTDGTIPVGELMNNYHLRFTDGGLSSPVNEVKIYHGLKSIEMSHNVNNTTKGVE